VQYLIRHVPWYGPIFNEAFRLEERHEHHRRASVLVEKGLEENPRYGPLWFSALRVQERLAYEQLSGDLTALRNTVKRALACVPKVRPTDTRSVSMRRRLTCAVCRVVCCISAE
jgi:la-related protein 1